MKKYPKRISYNSLCRLCLKFMAEVIKKDKSMSSSAHQALTDFMFFVEADMEKETSQ